MSVYGAILLEGVNYIIVLKIKMYSVPIYAGTFYPSLISSFQL